MKRRWLIYIITGILFGIFDFYYHGLLSNFFMRNQYFNSITGKIAWIVLSIGIWLVPIVFIALYEVRFSRSKVRSAGAGSLTWCASVISYYLTNAAQLALLGIPARMELHISHSSDSYFWDNWKSVFWYDIVGGMAEWLVVALFGGFIIGFLISCIYLHFRKSRKHIVFRTLR